MLAVRYLPDLPRNRDTRLDVVGSLLLAASSALLIYPLVQGREHDWPLWCFLMMGAAAIVFAGFVVRERRSAHPVIERSLFSNRGFVAGVIFLASFFVAMNGVMLIVNLFIQLGLGFTPMHTGLAMTPLAVGLAIGAATSGAALGPKFGRKVLHGGLVVIGLGMVALWWTIDQQGMATSGWDLAPALFVVGLGSGAIFAPLFDIILADLGDHEVGTGSGVLNAAQQFSRRPRRGDHRHDLLPVAAQRRLGGRDQGHRLGQPGLLRRQLPRRLPPPQGGPRGRGAGLKVEVHGPGPGGGGIPG